MRSIDLLIVRFFDWVNQIFATRDEFGLTTTERRQVLGLARAGEIGRDHAEELACHGFGITTGQFYALLDGAGISTK